MRSMFYKPPPLSLRVRLAALVLIVVAPIVALVLATHVKHRREEIDHAGAHALQMARLASEHHARLIEATRQMLGGLARMREVRQADISRCDAIFAEILAANPGYGSISLVNLKGDIISPSAAKARGLNVSDFTWFRRVREGRGFTVGGYQWGRISNCMVLICGQPLLDEHGRERGVVSASLRTDWLERFAWAGDLPAGTTLTVVGGDGTVWARHPDGANWVGKAVPEAPVVRRVVDAGLADVGGTEAAVVDGEARILAFAPLGMLPSAGSTDARGGGSAGGAGGAGDRAAATAGSAPVYVLVSLPHQAVVAPANRRLATELAALGLVTLVMLLVAALGSRLWIFRWMDRLAVATRRVAAGELSARAELTGGPREFRRLGESFDEMAVAVERAAMSRAAAEADLRRSGTHLRNVLNNLFAFVTVLTPDGILTEVNEAALKAVGVEAEDVLGKPFERTPWWANSAHERTRLREAIARAARGEASRYDTSPRVAADGNPIFVDTMVAPMFDEHGGVTHLVISGIDVTEKRRAEQALRESEERLSLAMRAAGMGTWDEHVQTGKSLWSEQHFRLLGYEPVPGGEASFEMWRSRVHPDDIDRLLRAREAAMREASLYSPEYRVIRGDGEIGWLSAAGRFLYDDAGRAVRFIGVKQDVTARKRAEEEIARLNHDLQRRVGELQTLLDVLPVGIGIAHDPACHRIDANGAFARVLGLSSGANASLGAAPDERPDHFTCWQGGRELRADELPLQVAARTGFVVRDIEIEVRHRDGRVLHLLEYAAPLLDSYGMTRGSVGAFIDISERKKAEAERQALTDQANAERAKLEAVLRQMPAGVVIAEASNETAWGRIVLSNEQVARIWRRGDGAQAFEMGGFHADGRRYEQHEWPLARSLASGERVAGEEIEIIRGDGTHGHISVSAGPILDASGNIVAGVAAFYDITERKQAQRVARKQQAELVHLSRLSTMGQMAAGLAHELNQPLGAILNYAGVCLDRVNAQECADGRVIKALEEVAGETRRAGAIIRRLRGFARKETPDVTPTDINHLVREAVAMVSAELHYAGVDVELDLCDPPPAALADAVQIEQVMVNLLRNAIDAMRDTDAALRRMTISTETLDGADGNGDGDHAMARVSVIDAGCGIPPEVRGRIFDSFFTTKPDGLGMGLPICQSIIQGHGGNLAVASNNGVGTIVHFTLPLVPQEALTR